MFQTKASLVGCVKEKCSSDTKPHLNFSYFGKWWFSRILFYPYASLRVISCWCECVNPYAAGSFFGQYEMMQNPWKMTETLTHGYSSESTQLELSNIYQHDRVSMVFRNLCVLVLWIEVASASEGLRLISPILMPRTVMMVYHMPHLSWTAEDMETEPQAIHPSIANHLDGWDIELATRVTP